MRKETFVDYYSILGLTIEASEEDISKTYKKLVFKYHPDKNQENIEEATRLLTEINKAYSILGDEKLREQYDTTYFSNKYSSSSSNSSYSGGNTSNSNTTNSNSTNYQYRPKLKLEKMGDNQLSLINLDTYELIKSYYIEENLGDEDRQNLNEIITINNYLVEDVNELIKQVNVQILDNIKNRYFKLYYDNEGIFIVNGKDEKQYSLDSNYYNFYWLSSEELEDLNSKQHRDIETFEEELKELNIRCQYRTNIYKKDIKSIKIFFLVTIATILISIGVLTQKIELLKQLFLVVTLFLGCYFLILLTPFNRKKKRSYSTLWNKFYDKKGRLLEQKKEDK